MNAVCADFWDGHYYSRCAYVQDWIVDKVMERFLETYPGLRFNRMVDVGCGDGHTALYLKKRLGVSELLGLDASLSMLDKAKELASETIHFMHAKIDAPDLKIGSEAFDLATSFFCLHWVKMNKQLYALKNIHTLIKNEGYLISVIHIKIQSIAEQAFNALIQSSSWAPYFMECFDPLQILQPHLLLPVYYEAGFEVLQDYIDPFDYIFESFESFFEWRKTFYSYEKELKTEANHYRFWQDYIHSYLTLSQQEKNSPFSFPNPMFVVVARKKELPS